MFKVATFGGFLTFDKATHHYDVHADSRMASVFPTFTEADNHARTGVGLLFGRVNPYWDIMVSTTNIVPAMRVHDQEIAAKNAAMKMALKAARTEVQNIY